MQTKVLFFTAGSVPTPAELTAIAAIESGQFVVMVRNGSANAKFELSIEPCDYVAGTPPASYVGKPEWEGFVVPADSSLVADGDTVRVDFGSGVPAPGIAVADGKFDGDLLVKFDGTIGTVKNAQSFMLPVSINDSPNANFTIVPTVVNGAITGFKLNEVV